MNKTFGIVAHVDAGKTTFSENLLYHTKAIRQKGRVDHKDAFLDSHEIERQRGITVFADQAIFNYNNSTYYLIDTPGHVDFSPEMERALQVMDYAIIILSAVEGIEGHTETVWQLLRKYAVPTFFFINKIDRIGANVEQVIKDIKLHFTEDVFDITDTLHNGEMCTELAEFVAEHDETLLDYYFEFGYEKEKWIKTVQQLIFENRFYPVASGSALQDIGIESFMEKLDLLTVTDYVKEQPFSGRVYKIRHDDNGTRITYFKALSGVLKVRDELNYQEIDEKITQIRLYNGTKYQTVNEACAGQLFAVTGLTSLSIGDVVGNSHEKTSFESLPALKSKVTFETKINKKEALKFFFILDAEDPSLHVLWDETTQEIYIHVMGTIQLEVLKQIVYDRFGLIIAFEEPEILYKESIAKETIGYGHFEPLGHYAEVHIKLEPGERNSGIRFENNCHADDLSVGHQNLIYQHLFERDHHGLITGSPITDIKITLLTGRAHNKHTSGGDFREATYRALRQGLEKTINVLLEPIYQFKIKVHIDYLGRVLSDIQQAHGKFEAPNNEGDTSIIIGTAPVETFMNYSSKLAAFTQGKGSISLSLAGYEKCHNDSVVIDRIGYKKNADPVYTSTSIFCSKGKGYSVSWEDAEKEMHCL